MSEAQRLERLDRPAFSRERRLRVHSTKYDGTLHYEYEAYLLDASDTVIRCWAPEGTPVVGYRGEGQLQEGMTMLFFTDRWYNLSHWHRPLGRRGLEIYVNLAQPAAFDGEVVRWVDLDIDVIRDRAGIAVVDEDEFAEHRVSMRYPDEVAELVLGTASEVARLLAAGAFPFDRQSHLPVE